MAVLVLTLGNADLRGQADVPGKKVAVLIGVKYYENANFGNLYYTENDVVELAKILRTNGFEIALLSDGQPKSHQPTRANILRHMEESLKGRRRQDLVLFAFAGHGLQFKDDKASYFLPRDAEPNRPETMISLKSVYETIEECGAETKIMFVDACRNVVDKNRFRSLDGDTTPPPPKGVCALFSCSAGQSALEINEYRHGLFFKHLLDGLRGSARDEDNEITIMRLAEYTMKKVTRSGFPQNPVLKGETTYGVLLRVKDMAPKEATVLVPAAPKNARPDLTNSFGMKLITLPRGAFRMGAPRSDGRADESEKPDHRVELTRSFRMGQTEVTQAVYRKVTGKNPSKVVGDALPVHNVSWFEAIMFCNALSLQEGLPLYYDLEGNTVKITNPDGIGYRLPTEAEWEYACRAGSQTDWGFGDDIEEARDSAFLQLNATAPQPVAKLKANGFGLFDMHGNVAEWCWDSYRKYTADDQVDPVVTGSENKVYRGGSFRQNPVDARCASRGRANAFEGDPEIGFRVARSLPN